MSELMYTFEPERAHLPKALIIGDSISMGYTQGVIERLADVCNIRRAQANCGNTKLGLQLIDAWLSDVRWDLIHFNWGLHDVAHRHPDSTAYGHRDKVRGQISVPIDEYRANLEQLVETMKLRATTLVFATTTVIPPGEVGRFEGDEARYNIVAREVMDGHGVAVNDLYALTTKFPPSMFVRPADVHFTEEGSARLAHQVADSIREHLQ